MLAHPECLLFVNKCFTQLSALLVMYLPLINCGAS